MRDPLVVRRPAACWSPCRPQPGGPRSRRGTRSSRVALCALTVLFLIGGVGFRAVAEETSKEQMQGLDEQVQEIKSDVLRIAAELSLLEEKLLYPSDTQVSVFVSLAEGSTLRLDSLQLQIDGEPVARHIYSWKELEALAKGGVQRLYTANLATGEHQLEVAVAGSRSDGEGFSGTQSLRFKKAAEPMLIGVSLAGDGSGDAGIQLGEW